MAVRLPPDRSGPSPDQLEPSPDDSRASTARPGVPRTNRSRPRTIRGRPRLARGRQGAAWGLPRAIRGRVRTNRWLPRLIRGRPLTNRGRALQLGSGSLRTVISDCPITTGSRRLDFQEMGKPRFSTPGKSAETWHDQTPAEKRTLSGTDRATPSDGCG